MKCQLFSNMKTHKVELAVVNFFGKEKKFTIVNLFTICMGIYVENIY